LQNAYIVIASPQSPLADKAISQHVDNPQNYRGTSCLAMTGTGQKLGFCKALNDMVKGSRSLPATRPASQGFSRGGRASIRDFLGIQLE
jgi:hypothetical protein